MFGILKEEALFSLKNTFETNIPTGKKVILAVDSSLQVILEILALGAGGQEFYTKLNITRIVSISYLNADQVRQKLSLQRNTVLNDTIIVFLVNPTCIISKIIADTVRNHEFGLSWMIMWNSSPTSDCILELERQGVSGFVKQCHLSLGLLPIDQNTMSLCQDGIFNDLYLKQDPKSLTQIVQSLLSLEKITGSQFKDISCYGKFSEQIKSMLEMAHKIIFPLGNDGNHNSIDLFGPGLGSDMGAGNNSNGVIYDKLILIDRLEDPFSMLLTPMTYEGLLDGLIGLNHGVVLYEKEKPPSDISSTTQTQTSNSQNTQSTFQKVYLNDQVDELYGEIRDVNFNLLISSVLKEIVQEFAAEARPNTNANTIPTQNIFEISNLLKKMPSLVKKKKSLSHHLDLVSYIKTKASQEYHLRLCIEAEMKIICAGKSMKALEEVDLFFEETLLRHDENSNTGNTINTGIALHDVLKILCLRSIITGGFKENEKKLEWYRKQLCHTYGHAQVVPLLIHLKKIHFFSKNSKQKWNFHSLKKQFALIQAFLEDEETKKPKGIHFMFPYTGYAPLSVRLVQDKLHLKFRTTSTTTSNTISSSSSSSSSSSTTTTTTTFISGNNKQQQEEKNSSHKRIASFEQITKKIMSNSSRTLEASMTKNMSNPNTESQHILVYYIGGVTVAEMAAFRYLNTKYEGQLHFTIASTNIINTQRLFRNFSDI